MSLPIDSDILLITLGPTKDKKVLFEFIQDNQKEKFFKDKNIYQFIDKVLNYWNEFFIENLKLDDNTCVIYADKKIIIIVADKNVNQLITFFVKHYEKHENYEICATLEIYQQAWTTYIKKNKKNKITAFLPKTTKTNISKNDASTS